MIKRTRRSPASPGEQCTRATNRTSSEPAKGGGQAWTPRPRPPADGHSGQLWPMPSVTASCRGVSYRPASLQYLRSHGHLWGNSAHYAKVYHELFTHACVSVYEHNPPQTLPQTSEFSQKSTATPQRFTGPPNTGTCTPMPTTLQNKNVHTTGGSQTFSVTQWELWGRLAPASSR